MLVAAAPTKPILHPKSSCIFDSTQVIVFGNSGDILGLIVFLKVKSRSFALNANTGPLNFDISRLMSPHVMRNMVRLNIVRMCLVCESIFVLLNILHVSF